MRSADGVGQQGPHEVETPSLDRVGALEAKSPALVAANKALTEETWAVEQPNADEIVFRKRLPQLRLAEPPMGQVLTHWTLFAQIAPPSDHAPATDPPPPAAPLPRYS